MADTPDWQALTLARLTDTDPDEVDTTDRDAWMLAYATLNARHGEVNPPEVLAGLASRVESCERSLDTVVRTNEMTFKAIGDQFDSIWAALKSAHDFQMKTVGALTKKRRPPASDAANTTLGAGT
ncbi:hypothetical protein [Nocardiopsis sp. FR26]|uniref:hypothetical protein n=1 Tax=Nocardiopsis sp. FR26 TaxID=2605987 RepID=UPI0013598830|nr:hypothetical protein [Nocardiopsis sp. FR26]